jgi:23S rRNA (guanine745-N1)-methyltransferase
MGRLEEEMKRRARPLICPLCEMGLTKVGNALKCPQAHAFDISREGYVNLLLGGGRRPKVLGDTKDMLRARRRFLDCGHYSPLSDAINVRVRAYLGRDGEWRDDASSIGVADIGCGEGYYVGRLRRHLDCQLEHQTICYFGMDVSKEAARLAAKRHKGVHFVVADVRRKVLFSDHSIQVLLNVFAPRDPVEFGRVVARGGLLLIVIPGPDHLAGLRSELNLLGMETHKRRRVIDQFAGIFRLVGEHVIEYGMLLTGEELVHLIQMTPNYWHTPEEGWNDMRAMGSFQARASFVILEFHRE